MTDKDNYTEVEIRAIKKNEASNFFGICLERKDSTLLFSLVVPENVEDFLFYGKIFDYLQNNTIGDVNNPNEKISIPDVDFKIIYEKIISANDDIKIKPFVNGCILSNREVLYSINKLIYHLVAQTLDELQSNGLIMDQETLMAQHHENNERSGQHLIFRLLIEGIAAVKADKYDELVHLSEYLHIPICPYINGDSAMIWELYGVKNRYITGVSMADSWDTVLDAKKFICCTK